MPKFLITIHRAGKTGQEDDPVNRNDFRGETVWETSFHLTYVDNIFL